MSVCRQRERGTQCGGPRAYDRELQAIVESSVQTDGASDNEEHDIG